MEFCKLETIATIDNLEKQLFSTFAAVTVCVGLSVALILITFIAAAGCMTLCSRSHNIVRTKGCSNTSRRLRIPVEETCAHCSYNEKNSLAGISQLQQNDFIATCIPLFEQTSSDSGELVI